MREKYEVMKMEVIAFEEGIWKTQGITPADVSNGGRTLLIDDNQTATTRN